mgnify:CR=1 FL=1
MGTRDVQHRIAHLQCLQMVSTVLYTYVRINLLKSRFVVWRKYTVCICSSYICSRYVVYVRSFAIPELFSHVIGIIHVFMYHILAVL